MLTLILLVVLGGGAGLLAVSLIDSGGLSRLVGSRRASLRRTRGGHTTRRTPAAVSTAATLTRPREPDRRADPDTGWDVVAVRAPDVGAGPVLLEPPAPTVPATPEPAAASTVVAPSPPRPRPSRPVPAAYTAVEGTYREVARAPWWRRALSLLLLALILVVLGVAVAAVAGAIIGVVAELVDGAIG